MNESAPRQKRTVRYLRLSATSDWLYAFLSLTIGVLSLRLALSDRAWQHFMAIYFQFAINQTHDSVPPEPLETSHDLTAHSHPAADGAIDLETAPEVLAPKSGAHFVSSVRETEEITLKWKPLPADQHAEIQIRRLENSKQRLHPKIFSGRAVIHLPDGTYEWRIRFVSTHDEKSPWSQFYRFTVSELPN